MTESFKKKLGIAIGVILILTIAYFILRPTEEKYFDRIEIPPTSVVTNRTNISYIDTVVHVGLNILEIDTVFIQVKELTDDMKIAGSDTNYELLAGIISGNGNDYAIFVEGTSRNSSIERIAHELIHLRDYHNKTMILFDEWGVIYGDEEFRDLREIPYKERPWEKEAFKEGPKLARKIKQKLYPNE